FKIQLFNLYPAYHLVIVLNLAFPSKIINLIFLASFAFLFDNFVLFYITTYQPHYLMLKLTHINNFNLIEHLI
ncbi:hypothetical protein, partial [Providencia heimbachae]